MEYEPKVLGKGWYNIVVMPPILCDSIIPPNSVGKIGNYEILKREYDFILEYIKHSSTFSALVNEGNTMICKIQYDRLSENVKNILNDNENPEYELIMPYLGNTFDKYIYNYLNNCDIQTKNFQIISVDTFIKYVTAINQLLKEILSLNNNGIYHNDIKPNNLIYNEETNSLMLIDFNNSLIKSIPKYYAPEIKFDQEYKDIYDLIQLVLLKVLLIGLSNKYIFDRFNGLYSDIIKYIKVELSPINRLVVEVTPKDISNVKKNLIKFMNSIMSIIGEMDSSHINEKNTDNMYCSVESSIRIPTFKQRTYAARHFKNQELIKSEENAMLLEDKRAGSKRVKNKYKGKNRTNKNRRNKKTKILKKKYMSRSHKYKNKKY